MIFRKVDIHDGGSPAANFRNNFLQRWDKIDLAFYIPSYTLFPDCWYQSKRCFTIFILNCQLKSLFPKFYEDHYSFRSNTKHYFHFVYCGRVSKRSIDIFVFLDPLFVFYYSATTIFRFFCRNVKTAENNNKKVIKRHPAEMGRAKKILKLPSERTKA